MEQLINILESMKGSTISNYVIAGLDSHLLSNGMVRYFENSRDHRDQITPHSHRFNFTCLVLEGFVTNEIWTPCKRDEGDYFHESRLTYTGSPGHHEKCFLAKDYWGYTSKLYRAGDCYSMTADQVHSIKFSRGAKVLFFEGPEISSTSIIIEPIVNEMVIPTYQKLDYMFLQATPNDTQQPGAE